jgi:hypothetical protein
MMKKLLFLTILVLTSMCTKEKDPDESGDDRLTVSGMIIDHECTNLAALPDAWIVKAKEDLHVAYGHTSHGSQITDGMTGLIEFRGEKYSWNNGGSGGALDLHDDAMPGDLGNPDRVAWETATRSYLTANSDVNVIMWSWCGQVSYSTEEQINQYLSLMSGLEEDFPDVTFVYMTGHLDGTGLTGNLHLRNEQIRDYCTSNKKILYDFADIESYDPDRNYYGDKKATDGCNYDFDGDGRTESSGDPALPSGGDRNWAIDWQNSHQVNVDWYNTPASHTQPLNGNLKAYAAWHMFARLAGWDGN